MWEQSITGGDRKRRLNINSVTTYKKLQCHGFWKYSGCNISTIVFLLSRPASHSRISNSWSRRKGKSPWAAWIDTVERFLRSIISSRKKLYLNTVSKVYEMNWRVIVYLDTGNSRVIAWKPVIHLLTCSAADEFKTHVPESPSPSLSSWKRAGLQFSLQNASVSWCLFLAWKTSTAKPTCSKNLSWAFLRCPRSWHALS